MRQARRHLASKSLKRQKKFGFVRRNCRTPRCGDCKACRVKILWWSYSGAATKNKTRPRPEEKLKNQKNANWNPDRRFDRNRRTCRTQDAGGSGINGGNGSLVCVQNG